MDNALTRPQSLQELYKTYFAFANKFQFTSLMKNYIQNEEWKDKSQESVWNILSKISDDIGAVLTDDIVNYTRNVVDINTCKLPQVIEHGKMLAYNLEHVKNSYGFFPKHIQCLVDIFSINPEFLIGNHKNHILSDEVIKEILIYIRDNGGDSAFTNENVIDKLIDNPHGLVNAKMYKAFVLALFYTSIVEALSATYSSEDNQPIALNLLWEEREKQEYVMPRLDEYKMWIDRYISNEIDHPLDDADLSNTLYYQVENIKSQKKISPKFNPFKIANDIYFNGLNPTNKLSQDELDIVEMVMDYHAKPKYNYASQDFSSDMSTQYAYYKELEFCNYIKMIIYVMNNLTNLNDTTCLTYSVNTNKFVQTSADTMNSMRVVKLFHDGEHFVDDGNGNVVLDKKNIIFKVASFLCDYVFNIQSIRENMKTIATKHAMRGTAGLLLHLVNDYLIKELPNIRNNILGSHEYEKDQNGKMKVISDIGGFRFDWETNPSQYRNYGNAVVVEYDDDNEYFNIEPTGNVKIALNTTNERYWEKLQQMGDDDKLGVFTKGQIKDFYRNMLGMGRLQPKKPQDYDDICDFLTSLFKIGANPIKWDSNGEPHNPIDDIEYDFEHKYRYSREERMEVQSNTRLKNEQERQFLEYSGNNNFIGKSIYEFANNKIFYWKNLDYSSHVLHPFMYNLKIWNKLNNIIINGYKDYTDEDFIQSMSTSKVKFDDLVGKYGECKKFWKYNVMDLAGYTTRYEAAVKDEHKDDNNKTTSVLTGYDGLFYPSAAEEFLKLYESNLDESGNENPLRFKIEASFFKDPKANVFPNFGDNGFIKAIYSIYWQITKDVEVAKTSDFYLNWYSHLNYTQSEYQKIAIQLWYWRRRIWELMRNNYGITKYCLDVQGNSLILVNTFSDEDMTTNPYLIDLAIAQNKFMDDFIGNKNTHVPFCSNDIVKPNEIWVRWKSNPIAMPAFDVNWQESTGDDEFDARYRGNENIEMGQLVHSNNDCNDDFHVIIREWREQYKNVIHWRGCANGKEQVEFGDNRLPTFFDMEQSANVLALASWRHFTYKDKDGIDVRDENGEPAKEILCGKNPYHVISIERTSNYMLNYNWVKYDNSNEVKEMFDPNVLLGWAFAAYHYCPANGSLLIPIYKFDCAEVQNNEDGTRDAESSEVHSLPQKVSIKMFVLPAQMLKQDNFQTSERIYGLNRQIDLNAILDCGNGKSKFRFDHPIKVCRNTNMVFSSCNERGENKVKCAFLGVFIDEDENPFVDDKQKPRNNYGIKSVKFNSCDGATRYEHDSQSVVDLGLTKGGYFKDNPEHGTDNYIDDFVNDETITKPAFNSYDSNDKYVFVLDFQTTIDNESLFNSKTNDIMSYSYNILSDAGYIPHFAYQSLVKYDDTADGTAYTWRNKYLKSKEHLQFELLGLDDKGIPKAFDVMNKMVVDDTTDGCKTLINPSKLMDGIYRVWCEAKGVKRKLLPGEIDKYGYKVRYDTYFDNEYKEYSNPEWRMDESSEWDVCPNKVDGTKDYDSMFEISLAQKNGQDPDASIEMFKEMLDEYYVSILRTDDGQFLNEKRYILPPTKVSEFVLELSDIQDKASDKSKIDGYVDCNLGKYMSASIQDNHYVPEQVVFTGTQNPFKYDAKGNKIYSKAETLQYGNGILGLDGIKLKIDIESKSGVEPKRDIHGNIISHETVVKGENGVSKIQVETESVEVTRKYLRPYVKFVKNIRNSAELLDKVHNETNVIGEGQITIVLSHRNLDNIAKYHILNTSSNLYYRGSLPKDGQERFKFSDFKFSETLHIEWNPKKNKWQTRERDANNNCILEFSNSDIHGTETTTMTYGKHEEHLVPPYYIYDSNHDLWFLEQAPMHKEIEDKTICDPNSKDIICKDGFDITCDVDSDLVCEQNSENIIWNDRPEVVCGVDDDLICEQNSENIVSKDGFDITCDVNSDLVSNNDGEVLCKDSFDVVCGGNNNNVVCGENGEVLCKDSFDVVCGGNDNNVVCDENGEILNEDNYEAISEPGGQKVLARGDQVSACDNQACNAHVGFHENTAKYDIPSLGNFKWAHKVKNKPQKYLDYLFVNRGTLAFKISEESESFSDAMSMIPPFYVDEATKNKMDDLNDVQVLKDYSTFIHQSEEPNAVKSSNNFNPLRVDAILKYGVEQKNVGDSRAIDDEDATVVCTNDSEPRLIQMSNLSNKTRLDLQFEDGELDDYLKIYANYVRVDDGHGDFHYDFYFNIQNLFNSPFEYISSVTNQPNVLILPDSYLYLPGDKYIDKGDHNEIDEEKMETIKKGGELSIYGQVKVYSNDILSDVRTLKLFSYRIYNVSDDKPKFLIWKTYDVTKSILQTKTSRKISIRFSDVLWQLDEDQFEFLKKGSDENPNRFRILNQDVVVVQPVHIMYDWNQNDDFRVREMSFDISNDVIDFGAVPELCEYPYQARTLRWESITEEGRLLKNPYYDHWSDKHMKLEMNESTGLPRLTLRYADGGYNFETIYLKWRLPKGFRVMDTIDRLEGFAFGSTASDILVDCGDDMVVADVETNIGHVTARTKKPGNMYLGLEHSTTKRMNGYVITNLADEIKNALLRGDFNPTLDSAIQEADAKDT